MSDHRQLMQRIAEQRDRAAFAQLFSDFAPRIAAFLRSRGSPSDQAEELAQEVLLFAWHRADRFDGARAAVATWLFTIARNKQIDRVRKLSRPEPRPEELTVTPSGEVAPDRAVWVQARSKRVERALGSLPEEQAVILRATYYEGRTQKEFAEEQGLALGTVKSRTRLAFQRLRAVLDEEITLS